MQQITRAGQPIDVAGTLPVVGQAAPAMTLTNSDLEDVTLDTYQGKRKVLNIIPSVDTPTCAMSTRRFNELARHREFQEAWGVALCNNSMEGLCARAVVVLDADNRVLHSELVSELKDEPDYEAALAVLNG